MNEEELKTIIKEEELKTKILDYKKWYWQVTEENFNKCKNSVLLKEDTVDFIGQVLIHRSYVDFTVRFYPEDNYFLDFDVFIDTYNASVKAEPGTLQHEHYGTGDVFDINNVPQTLDEFKEIATKAILNFSKNCTKLREEINRTIPPKYRY